MAHNERICGRNKYPGLSILQSVNRFSNWKDRRNRKAIVRSFQFLSRCDDENYEMGNTVRVAVYYSY